ncbi:unnamed protein product [Pleuronectes platessa]|uniref:Uncharacterized protein n=1 Tax=Pleuronectes platessa TaxID=8262 RepID=A0A9N7YJG4_PLEPL|nr:unnamed protein product [Pleuronectes platessa]
MSLASFPGTVCTLLVYTALPELQRSEGIQAGWTVDKRTRCFTSMMGDLIKTGYSEKSGYLILESRRASWPQAFVPPFPLSSSLLHVPIASTTGNNENSESDTWLLLHTLLPYTYDIEMCRCKASQLSPSPFPHISQGRKYAVKYSRRPQTGLQLSTKRHQKYPSQLTPRSSVLARSGDGTVGGAALSGKDETQTFIVQQYPAQEINMKESRFSSASPAVPYTESHRDGEIQQQLLKPTAQHISTLKEYVHDEKTLRAWLELRAEGN